MNKRNLIIFFQTGINIPLGFLSKNKINNFSELK
jgi:hypothetical protein